MNRKKMIDVFTTPFSYGIFAAMDEINPPPPWHSMDINTELDMEYFGNISGNKYISTLIEKLLITYERETLNAEMVGILANICLKINRKKWQKLFATLDFEYNPIENYNMKERMTNDQTVREISKTFNGSISDNSENAQTGTINKTDTLDHTETIDDTTTKTGTETTAGTLAKTGTETTAGTLAKTGTETTAETRTKTGTETESPNITTTKNMDIYGFNSSNASNANDETDITTGETEKEYDLSEGRNETITYNTTDTKNETLTHNTTDTEDKTLTHNVTDDTDTSIDIDSTNTSAETRNLANTIERTQETENSEMGEDTTTRNYLLQRSGNIGVTTTQQMIEQERNIWLWDYFRKVVFHDVDLILTLSHYECEGVI